MKYLLLLCLPLFCFGQNTPIYDWPANDYPQIIALADSSFIVTGIYTGPFGGGSVYTYKFDQNGSLINKETLTNGTSNHYLHVNPLPNGQTLRSIVMGECDVSHTNLYLTLFDSLGNEIWSRYLDEDSFIVAEVHSVLYKKVGAEEHAAIIAKNGLGPEDFIIFNLDLATGEILFQEEGDCDSAFESYIYESGGQFYGACPLYVFVSNPLSNIVEFYSDVILDVFPMPAGEVLVKGQENLFVLDSALQVTKTFPLFKNGVVSVVDSSIYFINNYETYILDLDLNVLDTLGKAGNMVLQDVAKVGGQYVTLRKSVGVQNGIHVDVFEDSNFDFSSPVDVEITDIRFEDDIFYTTYSQFGSVVYNLDYGPIYCTIKNIGIDTINSFDIRFSEPRCSWFCPAFEFWKIPFGGANLVPGDSIEVFLGEHSHGCMRQNDKFCLSLTAPNGITDNDFSNNYFCKSIDTLLPASEMLESSEIEIYPNPSVGYFTIKNESQNSLESIKVFDLAGKLCLELPLNETSEIDCTQLQKGMYIMKIQGQRGAFLKKIVIQ